METVYDVLLNDWLIKAGDGYDVIKDNIIEHIEISMIVFIFHAKCIYQSEFVKKNHTLCETSITKHIFWHKRMSRIVQSSFSFLYFCFMQLVHCLKNIT